MGAAALTLLLGLLHVGTAFAAVIQTADDASVTGKIESLEGDRLIVSVSAGENQRERKTIPLRDIVQITLDDEPRAASPATRPATQPAADPATLPTTNPTTAPAAGPAEWRIELANGDHCTASIESWMDGRLVLRAGAVMNESILLPLDQLRAVWSTNADQVKKAEALKAESEAEDIAFVEKDGAVLAVRGVALGIDGGALRFRYDGEDRKINLNRLAGVVLAAQEIETLGGTFHQQFRLSSGDVLSGTWNGLADGVVILQTPWSAGLKIPLDRVTRVDFRNGRLVWLTDLQPARVEQTPYFDRVMPYRVNTSLTGQALRLLDEEPARGIAVHSRCVLHYDLAGQFDQFRGKVGFQMPEGKIGRVSVRVLGDGKVMFENLDFRGDQKPIDLSIDIAGVQRLALEVDFGQEQDVGDRIVWANPRFVRADVARPRNGN